MEFISFSPLYPLLFNRLCYLFRSLNFIGVYYAGDNFISADFSVLYALKRMQCEDYAEKFYIL